MKNEELAMRTIFNEESLAGGKAGQE